MGVKISKFEGSSVAELLYNRIIEKQITVVPLEGECFDSTLRRLVEILGDQQIIFQIGFGSNNAYNRYIDFIVKEKGIKPPITWVSGGTYKSDLSGIYTVAINSEACVPIQKGEDIIGYKVTDDFAEYLYMSNILPDNTDNSRENQVVSCFESIKAIVEKQDMNLNNIVRTWFFNNNILEWYNSFNKIRTKIYHENNMMKKVVPASTGIGAANPFNKELVMNLLAIKPISSFLKIREVESPLQSTAQSYGSIFSRAVEINTPLFRKMLVSGTASICKDGRTMYESDVVKQMEYTFEVIKCVLDSNGMAFQDVTRAICYFKEKDHIRLFDEHYNNKNVFIPQIIKSNNTVCRPDLLFEIELDAVKSLD